jgi:hypothetical protein
LRLFRRKQSDSESPLDEPDAESIQRLESLAKQSIEDSLLPEESKLIEEDAWTLSPAPPRARVGASGIEVSEVSHSSAPVSFDSKAIEQRIDDRFDRIEATMSIMEARLIQEKSSDDLDHALPTDKLVTVNDDGEASETENDISEDQSDDDSNQVGEIVKDVNLLDLYEGRVANLNPFLIPRIDKNSSPESLVSISEISALLLDNLSAPSAVAFVEKAIASGMVTGEEGSELMALITLANPEVNVDGVEHLPHRTLLMFSAMVDAWREVNNSNEGE